MVRTNTTPPRRRRNGLIDRFWVMLTCVMLLPVPVPIAHEHESFESPDALAIHVQRQHHHGEPCVDDPSETHWHFAMPSRDRHDDRPHDGHPGNQIPSTPEQYTGGLVNSSQVLCSQHSSIDRVGTFVGEPATTPVRNRAIDRSRSRLIEMAQQRHRCALSCVMRC